MDRHNREDKAAGDMKHSAEIQVAASLIREARCVVAFTGAGISTPSGIPDFRSADSGLWEHVDPMAVASISGFRQDPAAFYQWVRPLASLTMRAEPNAAHLALVHLEQHHHLDSIITQNIDMLHTRAGSQKVYELHGHMREATCVHCFKVYPAEPYIRQYMIDCVVPRCAACGGVLKPNVILFGEQLPVREFQKAQDAARRCDLMIIVGSSLEVAPASDLPLLARRSGAKIIILNKEPTHLDSIAEVVIHDDAATSLPSILDLLESAP